MNLGDFFSKEDQKKFAERNINLGCSILIKVPDIDVNYDKYIIVVAENSIDCAVAFVVVNSKINENVFPTESSKNLHVKLKKSENDFLDHDSFVNCSQLRSFTKEKLVDYIKNNQDKLVGNVTDKALIDIQYTITNAKTISNYEKRRFGFIS